MVGRNHRDLHTPSVRHLGGRFEIKINDPFGVDSELLSDKVARCPAAINGSMAPGLAQPDVMIAVEMTEEVGIAPFHGPVPKGIHAD